MAIGVVNLSHKFSLIKEQWDPKIIAQLTSSGTRRNVCDPERGGA